MFVKLNVDQSVIDRWDVETSAPLVRVNWIFHVTSPKFSTLKSFRAFIVVLNIIGHQNFTTKDITLRDMFDQFDYVVVENRPRWADSLHKKDFIDNDK